MTLTLHLNPWTYTAVAFVVGLALIATSEEHGSFIPMPDLRFFVGLLIWFSIPFVWIGWWLR